MTDLAMPLEWHKEAEFEIDEAYRRGLADGRRQFAEELLPALRWALAGLGHDLDDDEVEAAGVVACDDLRRAMTAHLRAVDKVVSRREWDRNAVEVRNSDRPPLRLIQGGAA